MVKLQTIDAVTANVTKTTFTHKISLTDGPFGLKEFQSVLTFAQRNGRSWILSIRTSDIAAVVFTILAVTFAVDHFLFKSRYLVHIGGAKGDKGHAAALDEKAFLHKKEARDDEPGQEYSNNEDYDLEAKSEHDSGSTASNARSPWLPAVIRIMPTLFLVAIRGGEKKKETASEYHKDAFESSSPKAGPEGEVVQSPPTSRWNRFFLHPWVQRTLHSAMSLSGLLATLVSFAFRLLFWPWLLITGILLQGLYHEKLNLGAAVPWQAIALKSTLHLTIWTIVGVTLLLKPNRLQGTLWKCLKWTHAVNWWLYWIPFESYYLSAFMAGRIGTCSTVEVVMFILRPPLLAYLYSGVVCDAFVAAQWCKFIWNDAITRP